MPKPVHIQAEIAVRYAVRRAYKKDPALFEFLVSSVYDAGQSAIIPELLMKTKLGPRLEEFRCPWCKKFGRHAECTVKQAKWIAGQKKLSKFGEMLPDPEIVEPALEVATPQEELAATVEELKAALVDEPVVAPAIDKKLKKMKKLKPSKLTDAMDFLNKLKESHGIK